MTDEKVTNLVEDTKAIEQEEDTIGEFFGCECGALYHISRLSYFPPYKEDTEYLYFSLMMEQYRDGIWPRDRCGYSIFSKDFWKDFYNSSVYKRFVISFRYLFDRKYKNDEHLLSSLDFKAEDLGRFCRTLDLFRTEVEEIDESQLELELELESYSYKLKFHIDDFFGDDYFPPTLGTCFQFKEEKGFKKLWTALKYAFGSGNSNYGRTDEFELTPKDAKILKNIVKKIKEVALERLEKKPPEHFIKEKKIYTELLDPHLQPVILSNRDRDLFIKMLNSDEEPNEALKKAAKRHREQKLDQMLQDKDMLEYATKKVEELKKTS